MRVARERALRLAEACGFSRNLGGGWGGVLHGPDRVLGEVVARNLRSALFGAVTDSGNIFSLALDRARNEDSKRHARA